MGPGASLSRVVSRGWLGRVTDLGAWDALSPDEVATLFAGVGEPWWLAGGWAVELAVGRSFRPHGDTDVLVLRPSVPAVQEHLAGWDLHAADPPGTLRPWPPGEVLSDEIHDMFCRRTPDSPWSFQFMVDAVDGDDWVFRRDPRIRRPVASLAGPASRPGLPVLAPEVQLLYKSGAGREPDRRPKDEADFDAALPVLSDAQRQWLADAVALCSSRATRGSAGWKSDDPHGGVAPRGRGTGQAPPDECTPRGGGQGGQPEVAQPGSGAGQDRPAGEGPVGEDGHAGGVGLR